MRCISARISSRSASSLGQGRGTSTSRSVQAATLPSRAESSSERRGIGVAPMASAISAPVHSKLVSCTGPRSSSARRLRPSTIATLPVPRMVPRTTMPSTRGA